VGVIVKPDFFMMTRTGAVLAISDKNPDSPQMRASIRNIFEEQHLSTDPNSVDVQSFVQRLEDVISDSLDNRLAESGHVNNI